MFVLPNIIISENTSVISRPIFHLTEIEELQEKTLNNLKDVTNIPKDVINSFNLQQTLNPDIWENEKLKPEIKTKLIKIAKDFIKNLELPKELKIKDILFVGSLANYNWSKYSDVDLHIVVDFNTFQEDEEFTKKFFDAQKNLFNIKHDITVDGFPVEIYVQDVKEKLHSSAVYSIPFEKWISKPTKENPKIDKNVLKRKVTKIFNDFKDIKDDYENEKYQSVIKKIDAIKEKIKNMRKSGLESGGEFSIENLVFKILRRTDFMEMLDNYKNKAYDYSVSINEELP